MHTPISVLALAMLLPCPRPANQESVGQELFGCNATSDIVYGEGTVRTNGELVQRELRLDAYLPTERSDESAIPAVILVHGGGFQRGGRRQPPYREAGAVHSRMEDYALLLAPKGYACFVIEYRLAPELPEPRTPLDANWLLPMEMDLTEAGMRRVNFARSTLDLPPLDGLAGMAVVWKTILSAAEDLDKAVKYVRAEAKEFGIDPNKIALGGHSAGAATVLNAAFGLKTPVAAVFPLSPPVSAIDVRKAIVTAGGPATMVVVSQNDEPAVMEKVPTLTRALRAADADFSLVWVPGFPHFYPLGAVALGDDGVRASVGERVTEFLDRHLR